MRHRVSGRHLNRTPSHRRALRRNLAASLFEHGAIRTTESKAKDVRRFVEKLITVARKGSLHARRLVIARLQDRKIFDSDGNRLDQTIVQKLFDEVAPRYTGRTGGYTRIIRLPDRRIGDGGRQVLLQLVEQEPAEGSAQRHGASKRRARATKRIQAASQAMRDRRKDGHQVDQEALDEPEAPGQTPPDEQPEPEDAGDEAAPDEQPEPEEPGDEAPDEEEGEAS